MTRMGTKFRFVFSVTLLAMVSSVNTQEMSYKEMFGTLSYEELAKGFSKGIERLDPFLKMTIDALTPRLKAFNMKEMLASALASYSKPKSDGPSPSSKCKNHTSLMIDGIIKREKWALEMIDAFGKPSSGMMKLETRWLGGFKECEDVEVAVIDNNNHTSSPFNTHYCLASHFLIPGVGDWLAPKIQIGVCFPDTCSETDLTLMLNTAISKILPNMTIDAVGCQKRKLDLDQPATAALGVIGALLFLMVLGTAFDVCVIQKRNAETAKKLLPPRKEPVFILSNGKPIVTGTNGAYIKDDTDPKGDVTTGGNDESTKVSFEGNGDVISHTDLPGKESIVSPTNTVEISEIKLEKKYTPGILGRLMLAFSVYTNGSKLLGTHQSSDSLRAVHGIRFISMSWVILGHTYFFGMGVFANGATMLPEIMKRWTYNAISQASVSVDTFFLLSGLLVSYLGLKEMKKVNGPRNFHWMIFYLHRWWRLTPPYMLIILVYHTLYKYMGSGPVFAQTGISPNCRDNFWVNMLYVQNIARDGTQCMGWAWYLANDMQFYVISPLLFIPFYYSTKIGGAISAVFLLGTWIASGVVSAQLALPASMSRTFMDPSAHGQDYLQYYYEKPWCRMGPYIVGLIAGYILYKTRCKIRMNKFLCLCGWFCAAGLCLSVLYGLDYVNHTGPPAQWVASLYNSLSRTAWGVGVAWVVVACATGNGGFINTILSWSALIPLSRLTYCAYLIHPVVMMIYYQSGQTNFQLTDVNIVYAFFGHMITSYAVAFVASLLFEAPMMGIEKAILHKPKKS